MLARAFIGAAAATVLVRGCAHLALTYFTDSFSTPDVDLDTRMKAVSPNISQQLTVWKAWIGFNASHSIALIFFGLVYGYLVLRQPDLLRHSPFLACLGALFLAGYVVLAKAYWFSVPLAGVSLAAVLYVVGFAVAVASSN